MPSTVIIMRDAMSWIHFILAPGQDDCVVVMLEPVIQTLFFVCWQVFVAWLPVPFTEFWLCVMIGYFLYSTWSQRLQSLPCLSSWAPFPHVCVSCLKVLKVRGLGQDFRRNRGYVHYFQTNFIQQSHHFFET